MNYEIIKFKDGEFELDINVSPMEKTLWLSTEQIAKIYNKSKSTIQEHINNIYKDEELSLNETMKKIGKNEGWQGKTGNSVYSTKPTNYYNFDVVLYVGFRVKSKRAQQFRKWASTILKKYIINGYALNYQRLENNTDCTSMLIQSLSQQISKNTKDIEQIKSLMFPEQLIMHNKSFTAKMFVVNLMDHAKSSILLVDPYVDIKTLDILKYKPREVSLTIVTSNKSRLSVNELDCFISEFGPVKYKKWDDNHDRYIIIDDEIGYILGSSLNSLGNKGTTITLLKQMNIDEISSKITLIQNI